MTKIVVDIEALQRMVDWLSLTAEDMDEWGKYLLRSTSDARSYDGQYAPWVQALASEADHDVRASALEVNQIGRELRHVAQAFDDADQAESVGDFAWALIMREMVERGEIPSGDWFAWRERIAKPPWVSAEEWGLLNYEERLALVLEAREAYDAQNERIARMRTPPWEKDPNWLWDIIGINPLLLEGRYLHGDVDIAELQAYLDGVKREYEEHWADFLEKQAVFKFGMGDDLSEAFLIYMFGLEGAAGYGMNARFSDDGSLQGVVVAEDQRLLQNYEYQRYSGGRHAQDINLDLIAQFEGKGYGVNSGDLKGIHYNLCGEITSSVTAGVDPIEALIQFEEIYIEKYGVVLTDGAAILGDHTMGTDAGDLGALMEEYGWNGERVGNADDPYPWRDERGWQPKPDQVADHLNNGKAVIALLNLDTITEFIEPVNNRNDASHWVSILQVVETREGDAVVRIFNPYQNREEWYPFDHIVDSWELQANQTVPGPNYRAVVGTPPEELSWLPNP